jgi:seryl-tRNA synthetase
MLDIKFIRENKDIVEAAINNKKVKEDIKTKRPKIKILKKEKN